MEAMGCIAERITAWLRDFCTKSGMLGYVVGLSGGIDSACTAALCERAMGDQVLYVLMPCHSVPEDAEMAHLVADALRLQTLTVDLAPAYDALLAALPPGVSDLATANIKPRLRMATLYALAQTRGFLVAGTGNRSELAIGYFTKYGDGGVDVEPLAGLFKWQVRLLARELDIPQAVIDRPPTAGLWLGQTDEDEMGITYKELDAALAAIESGETEDLDPTLLGRVREMMAASDHKRAMPPICPVGVAPDA